MRLLALSLLLLTACGERAMIQDPTPARAAAAPVETRLQTATLALG